MDSLVICCLESLIIALATLPIAPFPGSSRDPWAMSMCIGAHFTKAFVTLDSMPTGTDEAKDKNNERTARTENRIEVIFVCMVESQPSAEGLQAQAYRSTFK